MSHTPGPWEAVPLAIDSYCREITYEVTTEAYDVASYQRGVHKYDDAKLIAAAPDLLAALNQILSAMEFDEKLYADNPARSTFDFKRGIAIARAAIAKATE